VDAVELLTQFNLTRQEAAIYLTLLSESDMNGYEVAKRTGISRSNTYTSLAALVEKGAALIIEGAVTRYTPVPVQEFCENKLRKLRGTIDDLLETIPQKREETEGYITIKGREHIYDKMRNMVQDAVERVYISASKQIIEAILPEIKSGMARGIKVVLITDEPLDLKGATIYLAEKSRQQIRLIADSSNVLTGDVEDGSNSTCLYSRKKNLIDLLKDSLKNEIKFIEMTKGSNRI
jgi:HTH-type transcriptional regulator, sugar sensing transcriptional regulator